MHAIVSNCEQIKSSSADENVAGEGGIMYKYLLIIFMFLIFSSAVVSQEQPLSRIVVCGADGCRIADNGEYMEVQACEKVTLMNASIDPLDWPLEVKWIVKEEGGQKEQVLLGDWLNFTWPRSSYVRVTLNASNGVFSHETYITMAVRESTMPVLVKVAMVVGSDKKETEFEPKQQQKIAKTAVGVPITVKRYYEERKERDILKPVVLSDSSVTPSESKCDGSECETTLKFSKTGTFTVTFNDCNLCGKSEAVNVEVEVVINPLPEPFIEEYRTNGSDIVILSGKKSKDNDRITRYHWTIVDEYGRLVEDYDSEDSSFSFSETPGSYTATLCVTDRFSGVACTNTNVYIPETATNRMVLKANISGTPRSVEAGTDFTLHAENSTPRDIDRYDWRICYLDGGRCSDEKTYRGAKPNRTINVTRHGDYDVTLIVHRDMDEDDVTFRIVAVSRPNVTLVQAGEIKSEPAETIKPETKPATSEDKKTPAFGILSSMIVFALAMLLAKKRRNYG